MKSPAHLPHVAVIARNAFFLKNQYPVGNLVWWLLWGVGGKAALLSPDTENRKDYFMFSF